MRPYLFLLSLTVLLAVMPLAAQASIVSWGYANGADGALNCVASWDANTYALTTTGVQYSSPGHMSYSFTTDTQEDPTLTQNLGVDNETSFAWTGCIVGIMMDHTFTLSNAQVITPDDWTASITPTAWDGTEYLGTITYSGGTPVAIGDTLEYSYKISFTGDAGITESVTPIPEPVTATLLALGGLALIRRRRA